MMATGLQVFDENGLIHFDSNLANLRFVKNMSINIANIDGSLNPTIRIDSQEISSLKTYLITYNMSNIWTREYASSGAIVTREEDIYGYWLEPFDGYCNIVFDHSYQSSLEDYLRYTLVGSINLYEVKT